MIKYQILIGLALLTGVAVGYFAREGSSAPASAQESPSRTCSREIPETGSSVREHALRKRIAELEALLAEKAAKSEVAISNAVAEAAKAQPFGGRPKGGPREWMENLRKTDPARYTQMTNRFTQMRLRRAARARSTMEFLSSIDTSHMSAGAKKTHDELQELLAKREEIEAQFHQEGMTDDQRKQLFEQMRETDRAVRELNGEERKNLFEETARNLGFEGEAVEEISATLQEVIEATGGNGHGGFGPPPGGGPGGPEGAPGGGPGGPGGR